MRLLKPSVPRVEQLEDRCLPSANVVLEWNQLALGAIRQTNANPPVASRALAITQAAVYDSVNAIDRSYAPYFAHVHASRGASLEAAAAEAAHDTLAALFPSQASTFDAALAADLVGIPPGRARQGTDVGREVARQILAWRSTDGSDAMVPYKPGSNPGDWQPTPPAFLPAPAPQWPGVTPFAMTEGDQFRPPPPALGSPEYAAAFNEVKSLGRVDSTTRTADQTQIALFWRDPTASAYAFGHWNEIAQQVSAERGLGLVADARLFALLNLAEADAIISCWDAKYTYNFWRPVTAIRFPGDSALNPATTSDPSWTPLIVTPNFPSYTSAHSTVSGAAAAVLTSVFGPGYHFTTGSDGLPGVTRSFGSFDAAAAEAGQSRIYGGIHYQFDNQGGLTSGRALGQYVVGNFLLPAAGEDAGDGPREDRDGGHAARGEDGRVVSAGPGNDSPDGWDLFGRRQDSVPAAGQPRPPQPPQSAYVPAAMSVGVGQPAQPAGAWGWLAVASHRRVLGPVSADRNDSLSLPVDEVFAWAG